MRAEPASIALPITTAPDRDARLAALFDAHEDRLYGLARRLTSNTEDARDLVQETFLRAANSLRAIPPGPAKEEAWLVRVLVNIRRDEWRRTAVRRRHASALRGDLPLYTATPESMLMARQAVWHALDVLRPGRRAIVVMHELEGLTPKAIASLLGLSVLTVRWHLSMARRDLKRILQPFMKGRS